MPNTLDTFIDRLLVCTNIKANLMDFDASELANCVIRSCEQMLCILGSKDHYAHDDNNLGIPSSRTPLIPG